MRRNHAYLSAMVSPEQRARFEADFPESGLPPLPKKRVFKPRVGPSEHQVQVAVVDWWNAQCSFYGLPHFALFAIPNGGARDPITGARLKAEGVRKGVFDLMLAVPRHQNHGLFIEMKVGDGRPSEDQKDFLHHLQNHFYAASLHWTSDSAIAAIKEYLA